MRIRITRPGIYRSGIDMVPVGTELDVPDDFNGWANKWVRVDSPDARLEVAIPDPGGASLEDTDLELLRTEYEQRFGKRPHGTMKADTIRARLAEPEQQ